MARLRQGYGAASAIDRAVRAQGGAVVKPHQVKAMVIAARRAYAEQSKLGLVDDGVDFDAWRKAALHDIVGAAAPSSFRAVTQRDYAAVMAYFARLAGERFEKFERFEKSGGNNPSNLSNASNVSNLSNPDEVQRALWALNLVEGEVARSFGGREGARRYADALFGKIHRTSRLAASAKQIWAVIFTMRNRAAGRRARTALGARGAAGASLSLPVHSERFPAFSRAF